MAETPPGPAQRYRVLIVDDNAPGRRALGKVLESSGYDVQSAATGAQALDLLVQPPPPEFVLVDLILPDLDGREVARAATLLAPRPYVALMTGWTLEPDLQNPARWGVDHVFLKPLRAAELVAKLAAVREQRTKGEPAG